MGRKDPAKQKEYMREYRKNPEVKLKDVERHRERRKLHPELIKAQTKKCADKRKENGKSKAYYLKTKDRQLARSLRWNKNHMGECLERAKKLYHENPEKRKKILKMNSNWSKKHRSHVTLKNKEWRIKNPERQAELQAKERHQRRGLGYIPLDIPFNKPFEGCERHHIDKTHIIYIPYELHRSVWHCVKTGKGMEEINTKAFEWLEKQQLLNDKVRDGEQDRIEPCSVLLPYCNSNKEPDTLLETHVL